jgi:hypothetical protein
MEFDVTGGDLAFVDPRQNLPSEADGAAPQLVLVSLIDQDVPIRYG